MNTNERKGQGVAHFGIGISDFGFQKAGLGTRDQGPAPCSPVPGPRSRGSRSAMRRGFTLIELLLVLMILAFLATIVVPKLSGTGEKARIKTTIAQIGMFETALERFRVDNGRYPSSDEGLQALVEQPANCPNWDKEGYLGKEVPLDPWGNAYRYVYPGQHNARSFDIWSYGPDGQDGGEDDINNWTQGQGQN
jgi:general secretion pathway protein G